MQVQAVVDAILETVSSGRSGQALVQRAAEATESLAASVSVTVAPDGSTTTNVPVTASATAAPVLGAEKTLRIRDKTYNLVSTGNMLLIMLGDYMSLAEAIQACF